MLLSARYVLPVSSMYIENGAVRVVDDKITDIGSALELKLRYPQDKLTDYGTAVLMPGFVDGHSHLEMTALRGIVNDLPYAQWMSVMLDHAAKLSDSDWSEAAVFGAAEAISSGVTTIGDLSSTGASGRAAKVAGLRGIIYREVDACESAAVEPAMEKALADMAAWEVEFGSDMLNIGIAPKPLYMCHPRLLQAIAAKAADGTPVALQVATSQSEYDFIKSGSSDFRVVSTTQVHHSLKKYQSRDFLPTGVSPVAYAANWGILNAPHVTAIHATTVDESDIKMLAQHAMGVIVCPRANAKLAMGNAPYVDFTAAGMNVGIGSDSPAAADSINIFSEMRFLCLLSRATNPTSEFVTGFDMVKAATLGSARALGIDDKVGSLEIGKQADIIAVDLSDSYQIPTHHPTSAVVHTAARKNLIMTMVAGNKLYENGSFVGNLDDDMLGILARDMSAMNAKLR